MTRSNYDFADSTGIITGATGLLGSRVATALIAAGARVVLADLPSTRLTELGDELGPRTRIAPLDVTIEHQVERTMHETTEWAGKPPDFVFNNAGIEGPIGPLIDLDPDELSRVLMINVVGAAIVLKHSLRAVGRGARIVQTGSTASISGSPDLAPYIASKHALLGLTKAASREAAPRGIRVTALLPGPIDGPMMRRITDGRDSAGAPATPPTLLEGGRFADVDEIARAAIFLLSEESSFMTGTGMVVDGGRTA